MNEASLSTKVVKDRHFSKQKRLIISVSRPANRYVYLKAKAEEEGSH